jgi:hypothetical protein
VGKIIYLSLRILLIAVEVGFEVLRLWKERVHEQEARKQEASGHLLRIVHLFVQQFDANSNI